MQQQLDALMASQSAAAAAASAIPSPRRPPTAPTPVPVPVPVPVEPVVESAEENEAKLLEIQQRIQTSLQESLRAELQSSLSAAVRSAVASAMPELVHPFVSSSLSSAKETWQTEQREVTVNMFAEFEQASRAQATKIEQQRQDQQETETVRMLQQIQAVQSALAPVQDHANHIEQLSADCAAMEQTLTSVQSVVAALQPLQSSSAEHALQLESHSRTLAPLVRAVQNHSDRIIEWEALVHTQRTQHKALEAVLEELRNNVTQMQQAGGVQQSSKSNASEGQSNGLPAAADAASAALIEALTRQVQLQNQSIDELRTIVMRLLARGSLGGGVDPVAALLGPSNAAAPSTTPAAAPIAATGAGAAAAPAPSALLPPPPPSSVSTAGMDDASLEELRTRWATQKASREARRRQASQALSADELMQHGINNASNAAAGLAASPAHSRASSIAASPLRTSPSPTGTPSIASSPMLLPVAASSTVVVPPLGSSGVASLGAQMASSSPAPSASSSVSASPKPSSFASSASAAALSALRSSGGGGARGFGAHLTLNAAERAEKLEAQRRKLAVYATAPVIKHRKERHARAASAGATGATPSTSSAAAAAAVSSPCSSDDGAASVSPPPVPPPVLWSIHWNPPERPLRPIPQLDARRKAEERGGGGFAGAGLARALQLVVASGSGSASAPLPAHGTSSDVAAHREELPANSAQRKTHLRSQRPGNRVVQPGAEEIVMADPQTVAAACSTAAGPPPTHARHLTPRTLFP
jgi:hypothetical protein